VIGAAAAARVALSLIRGDGPQPVPGEWAQLRLAELERLVGRARLVAATALLEAGDWMAAADAATSAAVNATVRRGGPAHPAARLRHGRPGGRGAGRLRQRRERLADELGTDPVTGDRRALHRDPARRAGPPAAAGPASRPAAGRPGRRTGLPGGDRRAPARGGSAEVVVVDGEAGIGKTTLLRAWAAPAHAAGDTVLMASCGQLDRALPLDALLTALAALLRGSVPTRPPTCWAPTRRYWRRARRGPGPRRRRALPMLADSMLGPAVLYAALVRVAGPAGRAGPAGGGDRRRAPGRPGPAGLAAFRAARGTARGGGGRRGPARRREPLPATAFIHLGVLGREAAAELVGPARVDELYARSKGHPLFLTELAQQAAGAELPASLVESVSARCDELGPAGMPCCAPRP
jgi:hypothetical protein